jgi:hypothetical protein
MRLKKLKIDTLCLLPKFRQFLILSTCKSFIPTQFLLNENIFPERASDRGIMYVEAEDKETRSIIRGITFVHITEVLGVIYNSKSGQTQLKWRSIRDDLGKLTGEASSNSLVNLYASGALDESYAYTKSEKHSS